MKRELTVTEKAAGRWFRDSLQLTLDEINRHRPAKAKCSRSSPPYFRHPCTKGGGGTVAMRLSDRVTLSPVITVYRDREGKVQATMSDQYHPEAHGEQLHVVPEGLFTFTWLEGGCHTCGFTVRSGKGMFRVVEEGSWPTSRATS